MKAKEYLAKFEADCLDVGEKKATFSLIFEFMKEIKPLIELRNGRSNAAIESIIRELNQKWNALCRLDAKKRFKRNGFVLFCKARIEKDEHSPEKFVVIDMLKNMAKEFGEEL